MKLVCRAFALGFSEKWSDTESEACKE
jgi:hypothetical protein